MVTISQAMKAQFLRRSDSPLAQLISYVCLEIKIIRKLPGMLVGTQSSLHVLRTERVTSV